jgi:hypothetical protein
VDKGLWEAARSVRPFLGEMLTDEQAANVDAELARLLERAGRGEDVEAPLRAVLEHQPATSVFLDMVLDDAPDFRPPQAALFGAVPVALADRERRKVLCGRRVGASSSSAPLRDPSW